MFERNDDVLFICYDNEAYMNTGVQRSGATPPAARTATTEAVGPSRATCSARERTFPRLAMAHDIPYVATATVADLHDLEEKVEQPWSSAAPATFTSSCRAPSAGARARATRSRWPDWPRRRGSSPSSRPRTARSQQCRRSATATPVEAYLSIQRRYAHLFGEHPRPDIVARIQAIADRNIATYGLITDMPMTRADTRGDR